MLRWPGRFARCRMPCDDTFPSGSLLKFLAVKTLRHERATSQFFSSTFVPIPPMRKTDLSNCQKLWIESA